MICYNLSQLSQFELSNLDKNKASSQKQNFWEVHTSSDTHKARILELSATDI